MSESALQPLGELLLCHFAITKPGQIRLPAANLLLANCLGKLHSRAGRVLRNVFWFLSCSFQDLAASGGDCEDGKSLCHHHHALHRGGQAGQRGEFNRRNGRTCACTYKCVAKSTNTHMLSIQECVRGVQAYKALPFFVCLPSQKSNGSEVGCSVYWL